MKTENYHYTQIEMFFFFLLTLYNDDVTFICHLVFDVRGALVY